MLCDLGDVLSFGTPVDLAVNASNSTQLNESSSTTYAGIQIRTDNTIRISGASGTYTTVLDSPYVIGGTPADVYVERSITTGSLDTDDIGSSRVQCSVANLLLQCDDANPSAASKSACLLVVSFYDAASGGNLLDQATYNLSANYNTA